MNTKNINKPAFNWLFLSILKCYSQITLNWAKAYGHPDYDDYFVGFICDNNKIFTYLDENIDMQAHVCLCSFTLKCVQYK